MSERKKLDPFQSELRQTIKQRNQQGLNPQIAEDTESEYDDDYSDDGFDDDSTEDVISMVKSEKSQSRNKNDPYGLNLPSFLKDDDDEIISKSAMFLKGNKEDRHAYDKTRTRSIDKSNKNPFKLDDEDDSDEYPSSFGYLKKFEKPPTPAKRAKEKKSFEDESWKYPEKRVTSPLQFQRTQSPVGGRTTPTRTKTPDRDDSMRHSQNRVTSPVQFDRTGSPIRTKTPELADTMKYQQKRMTSPVQFERMKSPIRSETPEIDHRSPARSPHHSLDETMPKGLFSAKPRGLEKQKKVREDSRPKPVGSGKSSPVQGILEAMKQSNTEVESSAQHPVREKRRNVDKSQSLVDFLLDSDQPNPVPRKKGGKSPTSEFEAKMPPRRSTSPSLSKEFSGKKSTDLPKKQKSSDFSEPYREHSRDHISRPESPSRHSALPQPERRSLTSLPFPSLESRSLTGNGTQPFSLDPTPNTPLKETKSEKAKSNEEADDLLALFNQATSGGTVDFAAHKEEKRLEKQRSKTPVEEVLDRTEDQHMHGEVKQRASRQVMDNAIDVVAEHNANSNLSSLTSTMEPDEKPAKSKSKKSFKKPPKNYQGLGSLTMLEELKKAKEREADEDNTNFTTEDIRKIVYLEWLAKREQETKKKRKEETQKKKEEEEKKQKEREEKEMENQLVRRKWDEVKKEQLKEKEREKRRKEKLDREAQEKKERQKLKSQKDAERRREVMKERAKKEHQEKMKQKRKEEEKQRRAEEQQKKENEKALDKWMQDRSDKWVNDRKQEQKQKQMQEKNSKKDKEKAIKEAEEKYKTWREHKDDQLKASMRESKLKQRRQYLDIEEDEENYQPPWTPPSRVIPRRR